MTFKLCFEFRINFGVDMKDIVNVSSYIGMKLTVLVGSPWVPCGFPRKKWVPFINMHNGRVNDVIYCDNLGKKWVPPY